jgi:hypothetical protein
MTMIGERRGFIYITRDNRGIGHEVEYLTMQDTRTSLDTCNNRWFEVIDSAERRM